MKSAYTILLVLLILPFIHNRRSYNSNRRFHTRQQNYDSDEIIFTNDEDYGTNSQRGGFNWNKMYADNLSDRTTATPSTSTLAVPGGATARTPCEQRCQITRQYNPICASNNLTYFNPAMLKCAQKCGRSINMVHYGVCVSILALG